MLKRICCRGGTTHYGWALLELHDTTCHECGAELTVKRDDATG